MTQWQPQYDPRQQRPATPPMWQQGAPPRQDPRTVPQFAPQPQPPYQGYAPPQYPPPGPPQRPRKKSRVPLIAGLGCGGLAALVILIAAVAGTSSTSSSPPAASQQQPAAPAQAKAAAGPQTVTYVVTGSNADVTYGPAGSNSSGSVPMHVTKPLGTPAYYAISAQLQGDGSVSCEILVDGKVVSQGTANGGYNIADCEIVRDPVGGQWQDTNG